MRRPKGRLTQCECGEGVVRHYREYQPEAGGHSHAYYRLLIGFMALGLLVCIVALGVISGRWWNVDTALACCGPSASHAAWFQLSFLAEFFLPVTQAWLHRRHTRLRRG